MTDETKTEKPDDVKPKKPKRPPSRQERWSAALVEARDALNDLDSALSILDGALASLREVQSEFSDWRDSIEDGKGSEATREKLDAVCDFDLDIAVTDMTSEVENVLDEAEALELPRGYGRD